MNFVTIRLLESWEIELRNFEDVSQELGVEIPENKIAMFVTWANDHAVSGKGHIDDEDLLAEAHRLTGGLPLS